MKKDDFKILDEFIVHTDEQVEKRLAAHPKNRRKIDRKLAVFIEKKYGHLTDQELDQVLEELSRKLN